MNHEDIQAQILLLADGELPEAERSAAESHLKACGGCRELSDRLGRTAGLFAAAPEPSEAFVAGVMRRLDEAVDGVELPLRWWAPAFAAGLAALMLLVGGLQDPPSVSAETLLASAADTAEEAGELDVFLGVSLEDR